MTNEEKIREITYQMVVTQILARAALFTSLLPYENNYLIKDKKVKVAFIQMRAPLERLVKAMDKDFKSNPSTADYLKGEFNELDELSNKILEAAYSIINDFKKEEVKP